MATIISSNFYLTNTQMEDNAGLIGYQNLVTPSTISATSQISTNPITNAANPATAWGWIAGDQPAPADSISYTGTNLMPSPFDPSGWSGASDPDLSYSSVAESNPSGESFVGLYTVLASTFCQLNTPSYLTSPENGKYYCCIIIKESSGSDLGLRVITRSSLAQIDNSYVNIGSLSSSTTDGASFNNIDLGDGYKLIQIELDIQSSEADIRSEIYLWKVNSSGTATGFPDIGDAVKVQAAYFGKADDYPAVIATQGIIPNQTITINTAGQEVDYIGIAKHNLNQIGLTVTIKYNGITVVPAQSVSDKQALLFLNNLASPDTVEIIISGATSPPRIAVLYVGKALRLQRNIYVGHTPISYGRKRTAINGVSENGQYLGEIVVREMNMTSVNLQNLTPDWYRQNLDPFFGLSPRVPCFWAWRPSKYEDEVGYCWVEGDPQMSNQRSNGMVECSWNFKGIV